jgi:hypothetical protein
MTIERRSTRGPAPIDREEKACYRCHVVKPLVEFGPEKARADGRKRICRPCQAEEAMKWYRANQGSVRATRMKRKFGVTAEEYAALRDRADGRCEICRVVLPDHLDDRAGDLRTKVAVDHDHATGAVRGLLCGPCNCAIGYMADDADRLEAAAAYLRR